MLTCWLVVRMLLVSQYSVRPEGTLSANQPIMSGRNLRIAFACSCPSASVLGGEMMACVSPPPSHRPRLS